MATQDYMERKIEEHDRRLADIEKNASRIDLLVGQFTESIRESSATMKRVEETLIEIKYSLKDHSEKIQAVKEKLESVDEKVICEIEKDHVDVTAPLRQGMIDKLKNNAGVGGIVGAGSVVALFELVQKILEAWPKK